MTFPINTTIPGANNDPADDQPLMQQNFGNINSYLSVDHVTPGATGNGFHKQSTYTNLSIKPYAAPFGNNGAVYSKLVGGISQLFFEQNNLNEVQITFPTSVSATGYVTLPGGVIMQWGSFNVAGGATTATVFSTTFPTALFSIAISPFLAANANDVDVYIRARSTAGFSVRNTTGTTFNISYIALGN